MKRILCYGDSNTWGYVPDKGEQENRFPFDVRWPGCLQKILGAQFQILEEGVNGRTTSLEDPTRPGLNGLKRLGPLLKSHNPLDLVVLMLGTNDLKKIYDPHPEKIAKRLGELVRTIALLAKTGAKKKSRTLIISSPIPQLSAIYDLFQYPELEAHARELAACTKKMADEEGAFFLNITDLIKVSPVDGLHLDPVGHRQLAERVSEEILKLPL